LKYEKENKSNKTEGKSIGKHLVKVDGKLCPAVLRKTAVMEGELVCLEREKRNKRKQE
jgi:hypothetical protein